MGLLLGPACFSSDGEDSLNSKTTAIVGDDVEFWISFSSPGDFFANETSSRMKMTVSGDVWFWGSSLSPGGCVATNGVRETNSMQKTTVSGDVSFLSSSSATDDLQD